MRTIVMAMVVMWATAASAQALDPNKPVTLTYGELVQLMDLAAADARAADAEARTKPLTDRITAQVKPPTPRPGPVPPPKAEEPTNGE